MTHNTRTTKYTTEYFEANGPRLINQFGDWGVFIDGEQVDGPFFSRQDAYDAYAEHLRERAEAERIFVSGIDWSDDEIPFDGRRSFKTNLTESDDYGLQAVA